MHGETTRLRSWVQREGQFVYELGPFWGKFDSPFRVVEPSTWLAFTGDLKRVLTMDTLAKQSGWGVR